MVIHGAVFYYTAARYVVVGLNWDLDVLQLTQDSNRGYYQIQ